MTAVISPPTRPALATPDAIIAILRTYRFSLTGEKKLQAEMAAALVSAGLSHEREATLERGSVIDFLVGEVGIEVKIKKGQRTRIFRQCERYCRSDKVGALILATNLSMGFPPEVAGKPAFLLSLGKAWL